MKNLKRDQFLQTILNNPKYQGKHIVVIDGKIFTAETGDQAAKVFAEQTKKYPKEIPMTTYIPSTEALIL